ncbi:MAG: hypothetical protein J7L82_03465 [Staphylothermus sp.]|nr:hypothetical protein [Staphylothermus sp.]
MKFKPTTLLTKIKKPAYLEKMLLALLNIIPEYYFIQWSMGINDQYIKLGIVALAIVWLYGILSKNIYYIGFTYVTTSIILVAYNHDIGAIFTMCLVSSIWFMFSITIVSYIFEKGHGFNRVFSIKGVLITMLLLALIYGAYLYTAYYIANLAYNAYMYIISITPRIFQGFYEAFITTRIGSIILLLYFVFIVYYVLNDYITLLISDTVALNKKFAINRIISTLRNEAKNIYIGKDSFQKLFVRSFFFIIMFYLYGMTYPLYRNFYNFIHQLITYLSLPEYSVILAWLGLLNIVSYIVYKIIYSRIISVVKPSISRERNELIKTLQPSVWRPFYVFLSVLVFYVTIIAVTSPSELSSIIMRSLGLSKNINVIYQNKFLRLLTNMFIDYSYYLTQWVQTYILYIDEAYRILTGLVKDMIEFIWG